MSRRATLFAALMLTALTMGQEFAHVLEWAPKASYSGPLYTRLQESLYDWYGNIGGVIYVLAVICTVAVALLAWRAAAGRGIALAAGGDRGGGAGGVPGGGAPGQLEVPGPWAGRGPGGMAGPARPLGGRARRRIRPVRSRVHASPGLGDAAARRDRDGPRITALARSKRGPARCWAPRSPASWQPHRPCPAADLGDHLQCERSQSALNRNEEGL
jgi:hypothetical protein